MDNVLAVKIGGSTLGAHDTTLADLVLLQEEGTRPIVVHGGGTRIAEWLGRQGVVSTFHDGLRVTDRETLEVAVAILGGLVNKELVASLGRLGGKAVGISGVDGAMLQARIRQPELGYVGEITEVNTAPLMLLLENGYIPVVAPICQAPAEQGASPLNVNADEAAGEIAAACGACKLVFLTNVDGIQDGRGEIIGRLDADGARELLRSGVASGGMIPKLRACLSALRGTREARIIDGRIAHALHREMTQPVGGTTIVAG